MKAVEFKTRMKDKSIQVPENLSSQLSEDKDIRVIILLEEVENEDEKDFQKLTQKQFLAGYTESDSIYDDY